MIIYLIIPVILFALTLLNPKNKYIEWVIFLVVGFFLCTTYFNGSDWRSYELMYNMANWSSITNFYAEKGFYIYMILFKSLKFNFFEFLIITKFIIYYIFCMKIKKYECNKYFVLSLFYTFMGLFLFIDCPLRNLIGIGLFYLALDQLETNNNLKFILLVLLAGSFHKSLLFFLGLLIIKKFLKLIYKISKEKILLILTSIWIVLSFQNILFWFLKKLPLFSQRLSSYLNNSYSEGQILSLGNLEKISIIIIIIIYKKQLFDNRKYVFVYMYIILYFILYRIGLTFPILSRYVFCFQIFYYIGISKVLIILKRQQKFVFVSLFFFYQLISIYSLIWNTYKYIPYTSYFNYLGKEKPSYKYRDLYNKLNYYKRTGNEVFIKRNIK